MFYGRGAINKAEGQTTNKKITKTHLTKRYFPKYIKISYRSTKKQKDEHYDKINAQKHEQASHKRPINM